MSSAVLNPARPRAATIRSSTPAFSTLMAGFSMLFLASRATQPVNFSLDSRDELLEVSLLHGLVLRIDLLQIRKRRVGQLFRATLVLSRLDDDIGTVKRIFHGTAIGSQLAMAVIDFVEGISCLIQFCHATELPNL